MAEDHGESLYQLLGGETGLRRLVERFYQHMDQLPEAKTIRAMHPSDLSTSIEKLFDFMSGWTGGPQLFMEKRGHPMLRRRHLPFAIGKSERDQWMLCMILAIEDQGIEDPVKGVLVDALMNLADHMRNKQEPVTT